MSAPDFWENLIDAWPYSHRLLYVIGTVCASSVVFWLYNALLYVIYSFGLFSDCKITDSWPDRSFVAECAWKLVVKQFIIRPVLAWLIFPYFVWFGMSMTAKCPDFATVALHLGVALLVNDAGFYWTHRLLHLPALYARFHKQHHMFKDTIGMSAEFAHPVEDLLSNTLPTILGPLLLGSHPLTFWLWVALRIVHTVDVHSGYNFPFGVYRVAGRWLNGSDRHNYHHTHNLGNYGATLRFWDWIMGTDQFYDAWKAKQDKAA